MEGQAAVEQDCPIDSMTLKKRSLNAVAGKDRRFGLQLAIRTEEEAKDSDSKRRHQDRNKMKDTISRSRWGSGRCRMRKK